MSYRMKRYALFIISVLIVGVGITMITDSELGTTAVTSLLFVLSHLVPLSFGTMTMLFNILYVILQLVLLRSKFEKKQFLQFFVGPLLGVAIDFSAYLLRDFNPDMYSIKLLYLIVGCFVLAFGVFLQLEAKVIFNPTEGIVFALAQSAQKRFGNVKITFDLTLVILALLTSVISLGYIVGIREGTILSAILIGPITSLFQKYWPKKFILKKERG